MIKKYTRHERKTHLNKPPQVVVRDHKLYISLLSNCENVRLSTIFCWCF